MAKPVVTESETGFNVDFGDAIVGVHTDQADTPEKAIEVATKARGEVKKDRVEDAKNGNN